MKRLLVATVLLLLATPAGQSWAYIWDKDMVDQPTEKPQESVAPPGPGSVPIDGGEIVPIPADDLQADEMKEAAAVIENPIAADEASVQRGKVHFEVNCLVCHGAGGKGDGPVGNLFTTKAPVDLTDAYTQDQADGQLYFTLTRGRALMPAYRDALSPAERWDLVNYIRSAFGDQ